jgi:hypothetical protein
MYATLWFISLVLINRNVCTFNCIPEYHVTSRILNASSLKKIN